MHPEQRILITMGDVAGIGPEIIARAWPALVRLCRPIVVGDPGWMLRALEIVHSDLDVRLIRSPAGCCERDRVISIIHGSDERLENLVHGEISAPAGRAAFDFLTTAIDLTMQGQADAIVTAPLHKEGLQRAGLTFAGHTEILAERTNTESYGMMLFAQGRALPHGLGVVHVTLHNALRDVFAQLSVAAIADKIRLLHELLTQILQRDPSIGVCGLNPHAGDGGLFGAEEEEFIRPAIQSAEANGINVTGPWPADNLFIRARAGEFDGVVAMYHDQGHIPLKLLSGLQAVNITVGLPIIRTSVAHGVAYDIAGKGAADPTSLIEAARVAVQLCQGKTSTQQTVKELT